MNEEEMRYRVSAVVTSTLQIVVQARSSEEAEASADAIDFDKWSVVSSEYVTVDVAKDFFERKLKVDWSVRESTQAALRVMVRDLLDKYGYPPDFSKQAIETVIKQAESLTEEWLAQRA